MVIGRGLFFAFFDEHGFEGGSIRTSYDGWLWSLSAVPGA